MPLNDDYQGADLLALHLSGEVLKIQLKGRLTVETKYVGKGLHVAFRDGENWYLYPHDALRDYFMANGRPSGSFSCGYVPRRHAEKLGQFRIHEGQS